MVSNLIDVIASLTLIMNEESDRLSGQDRSADLAELGIAKVRLVGVLETELARLNREHPDWVAALDDETREQFTANIITLSEAASRNAAILQRQINLSVEMMDAVAQEAKKLSGNRTQTYGASGDVANLDLTTPISVNSQY